MGTVHVAYRLQAGSYENIVSAQRWVLNPRRLARAGMLNASYLEALRAADQQDYAPLFRFAPSGKT